MEERLPYLPDKRKELRAPPEDDPHLKDEGNPNDLASALKTAKVSGKGIDMIERVSSVLAWEEPDHQERVGFLQVRVGEANTTANLE